MALTVRTRTSASGRRVRAMALLALGTSLALGACGSSGASSPVTADAVIDADKGVAPEPVVPDRWPLTGVASDEVVNRPALAVKIENPPEVRPQTGLDQADMVWEQVVEGGITRFVAVFNSQVPDEVGPIRSIRPMDPAITAPLHGIVAFSGGQEGFVTALADSGVQILSHDRGDSGFYRTKTSAAPHNVFGSPATFWEQADATHQDLPAEQFSFARTLEQSTAVTAGTPATTIAAHLSGSSKPSWDWDAATSAWLRSESGKPATAKSGAQLSATNVVLLRVDLVNSGTTDPAGNPVPETKLVGSGEATVATGGRTITATWSKSATDAPLTLATADGTPVTLAPGNTWIELVPNGTGSVTVS